MYKQFTILEKNQNVAAAAWREPGAGAHCVGAAVTCWLHHIAVDGPCLAITAFSHGVVVACGANSTLPQCKRGKDNLYLCSIFACQEKKKHKMIKLNNCED